VCHVCVRVSCVSCVCACVKGHMCVRVSCVSCVLARIIQMNQSLDTNHVNDVSNESFISFLSSDRRYLLSVVSFHSHSMPCLSIVIVVMQIFGSSAVIHVCHSCSIPGMIYIHIPGMIHE